MSLLRLLLVPALLAFPSAALAAEVVWLDGRRESVERAVVKEDHVLLSFEKGMRRFPKREIVRLIGEDGRDVPLDRDLRDEPLRKEDRAALAGLADVSPPELHRLQDRLADTMSRAVMKGLAALLESKDGEVRARAAETLLRMGLAEPVRKGLAAALGEKDEEIRLRLASALLRVAGALDAFGLADRVAEGLSDREAKVRIAFALVLARLGDDRAAETLEEDGLKSRDHHFRESAAEALARLGNSSGVKTLIRMLERRRHPAGPEAGIAEKVRVCDLLGQLGGASALRALKRASRTGEAEVAAAAKRALAALSR